jgi:ASC-1-like (ASCH) protein
MKIGDTILFNGSLLVEIEMILTFSNFRTMLQILGLKQVLPEVKSLEEGVMIYDRIYPKISQPLDPDLSADEREEMVVAFRLKVLHD